MPGGVKRALALLLVSPLAWGEVPPPPPVLLPALSPSIELANPTPPEPVRIPRLPTLVVTALTTVAIAIGAALGGAASIILAVFTRWAD